MDVQFHQQKRDSKLYFGWDSGLFEDACEGDVTATVAPLIQSARACGAVIPVQLHPRQTLLDLGPEGRRARF